MSIKRRSKHVSVLSMTSVTDVIFLLLIFLMVVGTLVVLNTTKVSLPSSQSTTTTQEPTARVTIDTEGYYYIPTGSAPETTPLPVEELEAGLREISAVHDEEKDPYVVLYADKSVSYGEIVKVPNASATARLRMILATKTLQDNSTETDV